MQFDCSYNSHNGFLEMRSLNLDQLRALEAVLETGSFSAAARKLHLSQPAISSQIKELERRFGVRLVERLGKHAHATPPGRDLLALAQRIFKECDDADDKMRRYRDGWMGRVRIGAPTTTLINLLSPILRTLLREHPTIHLEVKSSATRNSVTSVLRNDMDLAVVTLPIDKAQLIVTPLFSEPLVAVFPKDASDLPSAVTPAFVATQSLLLEHPHAAVRERVLSWLAAQDIAPTVAMELGTVETLISAVASNLGMTIVPESSFTEPEPRVVLRPLQPPLQRTLALIEHQSKHEDQALHIVRDAVLKLRPLKDQDGEQSVAQSPPKQSARASAKNSDSKISDRAPGRTRRAPAG
jgi:DNA-binding transcriptional LysR family regulator